MATMTWIASTAGNFSNPANWQGGAVPGINDTAILDSTGAGDFTLDVDGAAIGGFKVLSTYAGTYSLGGKRLVVGNNGSGAFHSFKTPTVVTGDILEFRGNDVMLAASFTRPMVNFFTDCDVRTTSNVGGWMIAAGATVTYRSTRHPDYPSTANRTLLQHLQIGATVEGVLDLTEVSGWSMYFSTGLPEILAGGGTIRNRDFNHSIPITCASIGNITIGTVSGRFTIDVTIHNGTRSITGDLRQFESVRITLAPTYVGDTYTMTGATIGHLNFISRKTTTTAIVLQDVTDISGDFTVKQESTGTITLRTASSGMPTINAVGTADQDFDADGVSHTINFMASKNVGNVTIVSGDYELADDSFFPDELLFADTYTGIFRQNGKTITIASRKLHFIEIDLEKWKLSGPLVFLGNDFVLKNTVLPDDCLLVFAAPCTARFLSENGKQCAPGGFCIEQDAHLIVTSKKHSTVTGTSLTTIEISGDMTVKGTLEFHDPGQYRIVMSGENQVCQLGKFIAGSYSEIIIEPKGNAIEPIDIEVYGDVRLCWEQGTTTIHLMPGNYTALSELCIPSHIAECRLSSGEYDFDTFIIATPQTGEIRIEQNDEGDIVVRGRTVISGKGICRNTIDFLRLEHLQLHAMLLFTSERMQVDHPVVMDGHITGDGRLIVSGTLPFELSDQSLDVGELLMFDGDASFAVPTSGYQSLTLEAKNRDSFFLLRGEYFIEDFTLIADAHALTVEVDQTTVIHCSGAMLTQKSHGGNVRWHGDGAETWILEGNASQTFDVTFEHGHHVLGTVINNKSGGDITIVSPLSVVYYRMQDGTPLPALANMTVHSTISLNGSLFLVTSDSNSCLSQEGMKLEAGRIMSRGTAAFFAHLTGREGQPLHPELVKKILLECTVMNPSAPYLHKPRRTVVRQLNLEIPRVLSPVWQTDENRLPEGQTYNFYLDSAMLRELQFVEPGLYFVTFAVKLFGQRNAIPFRYEILCERPLT